MRRHAVFHLDSHHFCETALKDLLLDHCQQIVVFVEVRQLEIGITRHTKCVVAADFHAWKEGVEVCPDDLLERDELSVASEADPSRNALRNFHACKALDAALRVVELHGQRQRKIRDIGKRVPGIDGERSEHGKDLRLEEELYGFALRRVELLRTHESHAMFCERRQQKVVKVVSRTSEQRTNPVVNCSELFLWSEAVRRRL